MSLEYDFRGLPIGRDGEIKGYRLRGMSKGPIGFRRGTA